MNSKYSYVNKRYDKVFRKIHGGLLGQHYSVTMHPDDLEICRTVSEQAFMNPDKVFPAVIRKHDGKGGYVITQWEYKAMFGADNEPAGVFCLGHDITEFMQKSTELKTAKASLSKTKLTLDEIAYIQSHGIRKPLANILGLMLLLETMEVTPDVKNILNMLNESADELDQLIRNMALKFTF